MGSDGHALGRLIGACFRRKLGSCQRLKLPGDIERVVVGIDSDGVFASKLQLDGIIIVHVDVATLFSNISRHPPVAITAGTKDVTGIPVYAIAQLAGKQDEGVGNSGREGCRINTVLVSHH